MPAIKNKRIQKYILKVHNKKRKTASVIEMRDKNKKTASLHYLSSRKKTMPKKTDKTVDQYVAFTTNMKIINKSKLIKTIPETYRKRWIMETGYRMIKNTTPKT